MKAITLLLALLLSTQLTSQTVIVDEHFSGKPPTGWVYTPSSWMLNWNATATMNYRDVFDNTKFSAKYTYAKNTTSTYIYIPVNFTKDNTYTVSFWTKSACSVTVNTNELANQETLLSSDTYTNPDCKWNWNSWYEWSFTVLATKTTPGYVQININTLYSGQTTVFLDDLSIFESQPTVLPIELLYFRGKATTEGNLLEWATATEHNNTHFTILWSNEGRLFDGIADVPGALNSTHTITYEHLDGRPTHGFNYYTLRQTDIDGKNTDSDPISVYTETTPETIIDCRNIIGQKANPTDPGMVFLTIRKGERTYVVRKVND